MRFEDEVRRANEDARRHRTPDPAAISQTEMNRLASMANVAHEMNRAALANAAMDALLRQQRMLGGGQTGPKPEWGVDRKPTAPKEVGIRLIEDEPKRPPVLLLPPPKDEDSPR